MKEKKNVIYNNNKKPRLLVLNKGKYGLDVAVLALLMQENQITGYEIRQKLEEISRQKIPHSTLHGVIKDLNETKYIEVAEKIPFKTGTEKKLYRITSAGVGRFVGWQHPEIVETNYFVQYALKSNLHPFLRKAQEWKMAETPNLLIALLRHSNVFDSSRVFRTRRGKHLQTLTADSEDKIIELWTGLLLGLKFYDYFKKSLKKTDDGYILLSPASEYIDDVNSFITPEVKKEATLFIENNPWIKAKMLKQLENWVEWSQQVLEDTKQTLDYCKPFLI